MATNDKDILKIRAEDIIEDDTDLAKALTRTPPAVSPARTAALPPGDVLLSRDASYEEQSAGRIERLKRPRKSGQPLRKHGWVLLVLAVGVLVPVLLRAIFSNRQQAKSKNERFAFQREQPPLRGPVDPQWGKERFAARQAQLALLQGMAALDQQDYDEAIRLLTRYLQGHNDATAHSARGLAFHHKKEYDRAVTDYSEAIRLNPTDAATLNNLAWVLATCPTDKVRDGKRAVENATRACDLSNWSSFVYLDTLAAAHAESGSFKEAVKWQKQALDLDIEDRETLEQAQQRLQLYEQGKPYRE